MGNEYNTDDLKDEVEQPTTVETEAQTSGSPQEVRFEPETEAQHHRVHHAPAEGHS